MQVTCRLLGVVLEENDPEELQVCCRILSLKFSYLALCENDILLIIHEQKHATIRPSVLEVLLQVAKICDLYLMDRIVDDESGVRRPIILFI